MYLKRMHEIKDVQWVSQSKMAALFRHQEEEQKKTSNEPPYDKTNQMTARPAKTQISLGIRPVWSVFTVRMKKGWVLSYPLSSYRGLWSDWADDMSLCWAHSHCVGFIMRRLKCAALKEIYIDNNVPYILWAASSEFVSSSIPSWQIVTAHAQPFRGARDLAFCLRVPLDSLLVWASSEGSCETARMRRLDWTFAARIGDKCKIRLTRPIW